MHNRIFLYFLQRSSGSSSPRHFLLVMNPVFYCKNTNLFYNILLNISNNIILYVRKKRDYIQYCIFSPDCLILRDFSFRWKSHQKIKPMVNAAAQARSPQPSAWPSHASSWQVKSIVNCKSSSPFNKHSPIRRLVHYLHIQSFVG